MLRVDVVTIFPDYLDALDLSLIGKAQESGLIDLRRHDLRDFSADPRHRRVDDTPYGGGAGMVMKPEPWGAALDAVLADSAEKPTLVVPTPSGRLFDQELARELAGRNHLVFACGRYEGIDERVMVDAAERFEVLPVSLGDYVLNGGEVAVLAIVEAVGRLLPGVIGNAESLVEESHEDGLLEYPVYTRPAIWRGQQVPEALLSGDHARIAAWRHEQRLQRTRLRRPDLIAAERVAGTEDLPIRPVEGADAGELWTLQLACWVSEAQQNPDLQIPALHEDLETVRASFAGHPTWVVRLGGTGRLVGSVRGRLDGTEWEVGRLMVAPDLQGRGLGRRLLEHVLAAAPAEADRAVLITGAGSLRNQAMYRRAGFRKAPASPWPGTVRMTRRLG